MSRWSERILQAFTPDLSRLWIAADPDDVLRDEQILSGLRRKGFELVPFEDSVAFRADYEERWRAAWDRGEEGPAALDAVRPLGRGGVASRELRVLGVRVLVDEEDGERPGSRA